MLEIKVSNKILCILVNKEGLKSPFIKKSDLLLLESALEKAIVEEGLKGLLLYNKPGTNFCIGIDPSELSSLKSKAILSGWLEIYYRIFQKIDNLLVPKVALIRGKCFSFGLELSLACDVRFSSNSNETKFSFQNLLYGLSTAFFSSKRLSSLISLKHSIDLVLSQRKIGPYKAQSVGLVDQVCPDSFLEDKANEFFLKKINISKNQNSWGVESTPIGRKLMYKRARALIEEKTKGFYPSYFNALKVLYLSYDKTNEETKTFEESLLSTSFLTWQTQNILHLALAKTKLFERVKSHKLVKNNRTFSITGHSNSVSKFLEMATIERIHFYFYYKSEEKISSLIGRLYKNLERRISKKEFSNQEADACLSRIIARPKVPENILSNFLLSFEFKDILDDFSFRVVEAKYYTHYENYPLLEILSDNPKIDEDVQNITFLSEQIQVPLVFCKKKKFGFEVLCSYVLEVFLLHLEGNSLQYLKESLLSFGFKISPFEAIDYAGLSCFVNWLGQQSSDSNAQKVSDYIYLLSKENFDSDTQPLSKEPSLESLILALQARDGSSQQKSRKYPRDKITDRSVLALLNKTALLLEEKVLSSSLEANYAALASTGFPDFWGGPLRYFETVGSGHMLDLFDSYEKAYGKRFKANSLLRAKDLSSLPKG